MGTEFGKRETEQGCHLKRSSIEITLASSSRETGNDVICTSVLASLGQGNLSIYTSWPTSPWLMAAGIVGRQGHKLSDASVLHAYRQSRSTRCSLLEKDTGALDVLVSVSNGLEELDVKLLGILQSGWPHWQLEISHGESIYTMEIGQHYKLGLPSLHPEVFSKYLLAYYRSCWPLGMEAYWGSVCTKMAKKT